MADDSILQTYRLPNQLRKAWKLTIEATGVTRWSVAGGVLVFAFGAITYYFWQGWPALTEELPAAISWGIVAVIAAFLLLFLANLARAPYVIVGEQAATIRDLQSELFPERISARIVCEPYVYLNTDGAHYAALRFTNKNPQTVILKGLPTRLFHEDDGFAVDKLDEFNAYESKLSWRGGSREGTKMIEPEIHKSLHIAFVQDEKLSFVFQSGSPREGPAGEYRIHVKVMGNLGDRLIDPIEITGRLEYRGGDELRFTAW